MATVETRRDLPKVIASLRNILASDIEHLKFIKAEDLGEIQYQFVNISNSNFTLTIETMSGSQEKLNEDGFIYHDFGDGKYLFVVIDTATSKKAICGFADYGISGAFGLRQLLMSSDLKAKYAELNKQETTLSAGKIMRFTNSWIHDQLANIPGIDYNDPLSIPAAAATFVLMDTLNKKITTAGCADTKGAAFKSDGSLQVFTYNQNKKFDDLTEEYSRKLCERFGCQMKDLRKMVETSELLHSHFQELIKLKTNTQNGCGLLNGMTELEANSLVYENEIPWDEAEMIVMASDGASQPYTYNEADEETTLKRLYVDVKENECKPLLHKGHKFLQDDSDMVLVPRSKIQDDKVLLVIRRNLELKDC